MSILFKYTIQPEVKDPTGIPVSHFSIYLFRFSNETIQQQKKHMLNFYHTTHRSLNHSMTAAAKRNNPLFWEEYLSPSTWATSQNCLKWLPFVIYLMHSQMKMGREGFAITSTHTLVIQGWMKPL